MLPIITAIIPLLDKILPNKEDSDKAKLELLKMQTDGEIAASMGQIEVNKNEANNASVFVAGARPAILWICAISLACYFIPQYLIGSFFWIKEMISVGHVVTFPLSTNGLMELTLGMLGLGGLRTVEKIKGVANGR